MVAMVLPMFFIGVSMVASLVDYHRLVSIHRPLGIAILVLVVVRYVNRRLTRLPDFLETMSSAERRVATWSERLLYALMFSMPLIGWGMLSAARDPIVLVGRVRLPPILPHHLGLYEVLRTAHTVLAYLFFATFLAHLSGVLFHALVIRDGVLRRMTWQPTARPRDP
jgi:cytochrome b561